MRRLLPALALTLVPNVALAIEVEDPTLFQVVQVWAGADFGVPGRLGALMFSDDGQTLFIVGNAEAPNSALYSLPVMRDPNTDRVTGFGSATLVFMGDPSIPGLDTGLEVGPDGTLFYTYWNAHHIGQRTTTSTVEVTFDMTPTGVPSSVAGLTFSPHITDAATSFGQMQVSSWLGDGIYNVPLSPLGNGVFQPGMSTLFVRLPQQGTGAIQYVPQGRFTGNLMYVNWDFGEVRMLEIDAATGFPIDDMTGMPTLGTSAPRDQRFAYDIGVGPWGLEFDALSFDFFVTTWNGNPANSIIHFSGPGFANQRPIADSQAVSTDQDTPVTITLTGRDADMDPLTFSVTGGPSNGTVTGTTATIVYTPNPNFAGLDELYFVASDGTATSTTATVTIDVSAVAQPDAGVVDSGAIDSGVEDAGMTTDAGGTPRDAGAATRDAGAATSRDGGDDKGVTPTDEGDDSCSCRTSKRRHSGDYLALLFVLLLRRRRPNHRRPSAASHDERGA